MPSAKPLAGITVVEIGHSVAAPYAGLILSELGADVIKVENPKGGDYARGWGPPFWNGTASAFHGLNRGKTGITVNFGDPEEAGRLRRLIIDRADAVIQNLRAGVMQGYGLGAAELTAAKPSLIYCDLGAFGESGPMSSKPGYDPLMQAFAGIMSVTGEGGDRPPVRVGVSIVDMGSGMWATIGILAALFERTRTGRGGAVATSLYETALAWMTVPLAGYAANGEVRRPHGSGTAEIAPYQCFPTRGGWLMIAAGNDNLYRRLCATLGRPELGEDARFLTNGDRVVNRGVLVPMIEEITRTWDIEELMAALDKAGIPNAPLQNVAQVTDHPQTHAVGILQQGPEGALPTVGLPLAFDGERSSYERAAPELGEHNETVLGTAKT
ncbi:MAG TPA: CoA transferase [Beijerinckiaceae bacterium]|nr:CoA transferase [Beijerinckiaceae bacterium]